MKQFDGFTFGDRFYSFKNLTGYDTEIKYDVNYNVNCNHWTVKFWFKFYFGGDVCTIERTNYIPQYIPNTYVEHSFLKLFKFHTKVQNKLYNYLTDDYRGYYFGSKWYDIKKRFPKFTLKIAEYVARKTDSLYFYNDVKNNANIVLNLYKQYKNDCEMNNV